VNENHKAGTEIMSNASIKNRRILVIDDNPSIHKDFRKILNRQDNGNDIDRAEAELFGEPVTERKNSVSFQLDSAMQGEEGLEKIRAAIEMNQPYALAFVDMRMPPGWDGLKSIEEIWKVASDTQIVICTAYSDHTWDDICERLGHSDSLLILKKPFDDIEVSQTAIALTKKWALVQQANLKQRELESLVDQRTAQLRHAASHDPLTALPNRKEFHDCLQLTLQQGRTLNYKTAVYLLDIDHFKNINDTFGHPIGDKVICRVARMLTDAVQDRGTVARLGGDEFAIIQSQIENEQEIIDLGARIHKLLTCPFTIDGKTVNPGISIGVAIAPTDGDQSDHLLKNADLALYRAKGDGRSCLRFFESAMEEHMQTRHELEARMRKALVNEEFVIHYQPQFNTQTNAVCCMEALLRWQTADMGLLPPSHFISLAEETGLIIPLGEWVLKQACLDASKWPTDVRVAVNVSVAQFKGERFVESVGKAISQSGIEPNQLEIEITESILLEDDNVTIDSLHALHDLGVRVVMDDFGTGFSSLSYLRSFPFDKLKIDMSFVQDTDQDSSSRAIVKTVANLGRCLEIETTAEGVETEEQLEKIIADGYSQFQGFLRGKPRPILEIDGEYFSGKKESGNYQMADDAIASLPE
jgi:diguanylate cyclase